MATALALATSAASAQSRSTVTVNGVTYTTIGGGSVSTSSRGATMVVNGVTVQIGGGTLTVDGEETPVGEFSDVQVEAAGGGVRVTIDGEVVVEPPPHPAVKRYREGAALEDAGDLAGALAAYRDGAEGGSLAAMRAYGLFLQDGRAGEKDEKEALRWIARAADEGYKRAFVNYGYALEKGLGTDPDVAGAMRWYERAHEAGDTLGAYNMAVNILNDRAEGWTDAQAADLMEIAAADHAGAMTDMGLIHLRGVGREKDEAKARMWLERAVAAGSARAETELAALNAEDEPPALPATRWYAELDGERAGPFSAAELRDLIAQGRVEPSTLLWTKGFEGWRPLADTDFQRGG